MLIVLIDYAIFPNPNSNPRFANPNTNHDAEDTVVILRELQSAFPTAKSQAEKAVQTLLGTP